MTVQDDIAAGGRLVYGDVLDGADWRLAELRNSSSCPSCGSLEPVRLGPDMAGVYGCSACRRYDRCERHMRWTMAEHGGLCPECERELHGAQ